MANNLVEIAKNALGMGANTNYLYIPESSTDNIQTPVYVPPTKQEFDWTVPDSEKPAGTEDWTWSRSLKAKQLFDQEQAQNEESAYKKYQADYGAYRDALSLAQQQQEARQKQVSDYYASQGLVAPVAGDPSGAIRQLGQMYQSTTDPSLQAQYHKQALDLARQAGWITDGQNVASVNSLPNMTMAGTPTAEYQMKQDALNYEKQQDEIANAIAMMKAQNSGGGGSSLTPYQQYQIQKDQASMPSAETQAMRDYLTKFQDGANARAYLQKFGSQGNIDISTLAKWGKEYFGDSWFGEPTVTFDQYGKATAKK